MKNPNRASERRIARLIAFGVILYAVVMNLNRVSSALSWVLGVFSSILIGLVAALILDVPMHGFERIFARMDRRGRTSEKLRRAISLLLSVVAVPLVLFVLLRFIVPQFINAVTNVIVIVQTNEDKIVEFFGRVGLEPEFITGKITEIGDWIRNNLTTIFGTAFTTVTSMVSSISDVVLALILAIYILADKVNIRRQAKNTVLAFLPERASAYLLRCIRMFVTTFRTFLSLQCLEAVILGVLILLCMLIFRVPYAVTIACMTALLALIPYVGAYLSLAIGCVLIVTISPMKALIFVIIFLVAQQVEGNLIYPRVVGKSVGLPAYVTLSAVMVGGALAGIPGMFFVIPVASVAYELLRESVQRRNAARKAERAMQEQQP